MKSAQAHQFYFNWWAHLETVRLILILLNFAGYFGNFSPFEKINQLGSRQEVRIAFFYVKNVGQIHS